MKKIIVVLLSIVLLGACANKNYADISNGNEVIFESAGQTYTSKDLYESMRNNDYTGVIVSSLINKLGNKENLDLETLNKDVDQNIEDIKEIGYYDYMIGQFGTEEAYREYCLNIMIEEQLFKNYIENDFDSYVNKHVPYQAELIYVDDKETADKIYEAAKKGNETFAYCATENGYAGEVAPEIFTAEDELPEEVKKAIESLDSGLSTVISTETVATDTDGNSTVTPRYYLVNMISKDVNDFKEDFINLCLNDLDENTVLNEYLSKYDIGIYDQRAYELLTAQFEGLK